jgi:hypothetical protein
MTTIDRTRPRALLVLGLAGAVLLGACGGGTTVAGATGTAPTPSATTVPATPATTATTATPAPTPTPSPTPAGSPTGSPTASGGSAANGGFAFSTREVIGYYKGVGYTCQATTPSTQAAGYTVQRCLLTDKATKLTHLVAFVFDDAGVTGNAFAAVIGPDGKTMPAPADAIEALGGFIGAMLGQVQGASTVGWLVKHLGEKSAQTTAGDILVLTYTVNDATDTGLYVEVANQAFMNAPAP